MQETNANKDVPKELTPNFWVAMGLVLPQDCSRGTVALGVGKMSSGAGGGGELQEAIYRVLKEGGCLAVGLSCGWWPPATAPKIGKQAETKIVMDPCSDSHLLSLP